MADKEIQAHATPDAPFPGIPVVKLKPKEKLYRIGEPATHAVFLKRGEAFVGLESPENNETYLAEIVRAPVLLGEDVFLGALEKATYRRSFAYSLNEAEIQFVSKDELSQIAQSSPDLYFGFLQQYAGRARNIKKKQARTGNGVESRIGAAILDIWSVKQSGGRKISQEEIASYGGYDRVTAVRIIGEISRWGIGDVNSGIDAAKLKDYIAEKRRIVANPKRFQKICDIPDLDEIDSGELTAVGAEPVARAISRVSTGNDEKTLTAKQIERNSQVLANLGMIYKVANRYGTIGILDLDDHVITGVLSLIRAIDRREIDEEKGGLASLGWKYIRGQIVTEIRNKARTIRVPLHIHDRNRAITEAWIKFTQENHREPQAKDLSKEMETEPEAIDAVLDAFRANTVSLTNGSDDGNERVIDAVDGKPLPEEAAIANELSGRIDELLRSEIFSKREAFVIRARHLRDSPVTFKRLGEILEVSHTDVQLIENQALRKFRSAGIRQELLDYY